MSAMLASVNSLEEAKLILNTPVDIIDLKQPELGALGALPDDTIKQIVASIDHQKPVSATIGDLPMQPELISNATLAMIDNKVDFIKIGFFPEGDWIATLTKLSEITAQGHQLIAVLFADTSPDYKVIKQIQLAGFTGVMLDTMDKSKGSLTQVISDQQITSFVQTAKAHNLLCGLAGSLTCHDISGLLQLDADYLGFRGALCDGHQRTASISSTAIQAITLYFDQTISA